MSFEMYPALPLANLDPGEITELRATVRSASAEAGYPTGVRELEGVSAGLDEQLWKLLAKDIGLAGVGLPESTGGLGGLAEISAVAEELGATLAPVPFLTSTVLAGQVLVGCGSAAAAYLERVCAGEIFAPAVTNARGQWAPDFATCTNHEGVLTGQVRAVPFGASASVFIVSSRSESGIDVFAIEAEHAQVTPLPSLDFSRPAAKITFQNSPAIALTQNGSGEPALRRGVDIALIAMAADALGGAQHCFDMTLEYVKLRRQFNREIGSFQAIKHRIADALMLVEMTRSGLESITGIEPENLSADASLIKAWAADTYLAVTAEAIQMHGGVGFTWEHDAHLYFRRARFDAAFLGDSTVHRERIASTLGW